MITERRLILASASPRRAELLTSAAFEFTVRPADVDETPLPGEPAGDYVRRVAVAKARSAAAGIEEAGVVILAADTAVVVGHRIMGKPASRDDAAGMLRALSGVTHEVLTGVVVQSGDRELSEVVVTRVRMVELSPADIDWYLSTGEHEDKAGAYAIQGRASRYIDRIEGSWSNVVGLPVAAVHRLLRALGALH